MVISIIRAAFLLVFAGAGWQAGVFLNSEVLNDFWKGSGVQAPPIDWCVLAAVGLYLVVFVFEIGFGKVSIQVIASVLFGLIVGFIFANLVYGVIALLPFSQQVAPVGAVVKLGLSCIFCYLGIATIYKTRDRFNFIIPYVEFRREQRGPSPMLVDTSSIIDGRVAELAETRFLDVPLIVPRFVLDELQSIADSDDRGRRLRGRRGLDILNRLQHTPYLAIQIREDTEDAEKSVDRRLISLAKRMGARIMTSDLPLAKIARLEGIDVLNLNELADALKPTVIPGEEIDIALVRPGEESGQAVGHLKDGTMVVVENGGPKVGSTARVIISSVLQRETGRLVFAKLKTNSKPKPETR